MHKALPFCISYLSFTIILLQNLINCNKSVIIIFMPNLIKGTNKIFTLSLRPKTKLLNENYNY